MYIFESIKELRQRKYKKHLVYYKKNRSFFSRYFNCLPKGFGKLFYDEISRPLMLICETTNVCNNDCIICAYGMMTRKKQTMSLDVYEKILQDYSEMGGGKLSLTPEVGDVLLDKLLVERITLARQYENIRSLSLTTNVVAADMFDKDTLHYILSNLQRLHISVYGLDEEEYSVMTRTDRYHRFLQSLNLVFDAIDDHQKVVMGFRLLKPYDEQKIEQWMLETVGVRVKYLHTSSYANWGGAMEVSRALPFEGAWIPEKVNTTQCLMPLCSLRIFCDGSVSFCPCPDYDNVSEMCLGNVKEKSLSEIFNSTKHKHLWSSEHPIPVFCRKCTFHKDIKDIEQHSSMFEDPLNFIIG